MRVGFGLCGFGIGSAGMSVGGILVAHAREILRRGVFLMFTADGRLTAVLTNEGRSAPVTDQDRANLFNTMVAYTGKYRIEGDRWIAKVDVAWNPALVGTEQARFFRFDGDRLQEITSWSERPDKRMARAVITWERAK